MHFILLLSAAVVFSSHAMLENDIKIVACQLKQEFNEKAYSYDKVTQKDGILFIPHRYEYTIKSQISRVGDGIWELPLYEIRRNFKKNHQENARRFLKKYIKRHVKQDKHIACKKDSEDGSQQSIVIIGERVFWRNHREAQELHILKLINGTIDSNKSPKIQLADYFEYCEWYNDNWIILQGGSYKSVPNITLINRNNPNKLIPITLPQAFMGSEHFTHLFMHPFKRHTFLFTFHKDGYQHLVQCDILNKKYAYVAKLLNDNYFPKPLTIVFYSQQLAQHFFVEYSKKSAKIYSNYIALNLGYEQNDWRNLNNSGTPEPIRKKQRIIYSEPKMTPKIVCYDQSSQHKTEVCDLNQSTDIIIQLLKTGQLPQVLQEHDAEGLDLLIRNFSPAEMAFEAEALNCEKPVLLWFFDKNSYNSQKLIVEKLAEQHKDRIKYVAIDAEKLFRIAQNSQIDVLPTFIIIEKREEKARLENPKDLEQELTGLLL